MRVSFLVVGAVALVLSVVMIDDGIAQKSPVAAPEHSSTYGMVDATQPAALVKIAKGYGTAKLDSMKDGRRTIAGKLSGIKYRVFFYGCDDSHQKCKNIQFVSFFKGDKSITHAKLNEWNGQFRFGKVYLDSDGDLVISMNVNLFGGVTNENMDDTWDWWKTVLESYAKSAGMR